MPTRLNKQQTEAVTHQQSPLLVVAGAGTGKTKVITERVARLIKQGQADPNAILAITFTEKAAEQMQDRVSELLGTYNLDVKITTFNAFGDTVLKRFAYDMGLSPDFELMSETQQIMFMREHIDELDLNYYAPITQPESLLVSLARYFSTLKSNLITPQQYRDFIKQQTRWQAEDKRRHQELARAYASYVRLCRAHNLIDFDDQIYLVVELLNKRSNIRRQLKQEIAHLLVDEYQDTNLMQAELIKLLAGSRDDVMVVGDDDQCIYNFRGAAMSNILAFQDDFKQAKIVTLNRSYRSTQSILDAAYRLIQHNNPHRLEAKYDIDKRLKSQIKGSEPKLKQFRSYEDEAQWIADDIKRRLSRGARASEIAVLLRKNSQARTLQKYLEAANVQHVILGETHNLYRQPEVKLLLWFLKVVVDPRDSASLYHLLASEIYNFTTTWLRELAETARRQHQSLETALKDEQVHSGLGPDQLEQLRRFLSDLELWREQLAEVSVGRLCYTFLRQTRYLKRLLAAAKDEPSVDLKIANLNQFFTTLVEFERIAADDSAVGYLNNLPALLAAGETLQLEDLPDLYGEKVRILTVHKAKGLEFETVYLFDVTQGTFPARNLSTSLAVPESLMPGEQEHDPHLNEERRLMYVAMTRAKRRLILTCAFDHGGKRAKKPSVFIEEIFGYEKIQPPPARRLGAISQIELFRDAAPPAAELPSALFKGSQLALTTRQIEDYLRCPREFYFRHILRPPLPPSFALEYGTLMHEIIHHYNQRQRDKRPATLTQLLKLLKNRWPQEGFISPGHRDKAYRQARGAITRFYKREESVKRQPLYFEQPFQIEVTDEDMVVKGRIDAVYEDKHGTEIRDYKTGAANLDSQTKADRRASQSTQLGVYALAWRNTKGKLPDVLSLDFIDAGFIGTTAKTERQLKTLESKVIKVGRQVRAGNFKPASSHLFCLHKDYGL